MEKKPHKITNPQGDQLDVLLSGNNLSEIAVVFVHGFGSNKNENFHLFTDIAASLEDAFNIIQFDFSGYGKSEGKQEDVSLDKMKTDLQAIVEYAKRTHLSVFMVAHSMGTFAVSALRSLGIERIVFTSPPNPNTEVLIKNMQARIGKKNEVNEEGLTVYERTSGETQLIGPAFWTTIRVFNPIRSTKMLALTSAVAIFDPQNDEVVKDKNDDHWEAYRKLGIQYNSVPGDHNFTKAEDRNHLIKEINAFFRKRRIAFISHPISGDVEINIGKVLAICEKMHSKHIFPAFPSLLWRQYLTSPGDDELIQAVNEEYFTRKTFDEIWHHGDKLSAGMTSEVRLAMMNGIPNIGKTEKMIEELANYIGI